MTHGNRSYTPIRFLALAVLLGALSLGVTACKKKEAKAKPGPTKQLVLEMSGMTCGGCVKTLTGAFKKVKGAKDVRVTLKPQRAVITYDSGAAKAEQFVKAAEKAGYKAKIASDKALEVKG